MTTRREFLKSSGITIAGISMLGLKNFKYAVQDNYKIMRPQPEVRNFISEAVEHKIAEVKKNIKDKEIAWLFENCYPNTLDTTVKYGLKWQTRYFCNNRRYKCNVVKRFKCTGSCIFPLM